MNNKNMINNLIVDTRPSNPGRDTILAKLRFDEKGRCTNAFQVLSQPSILKMAYSNIKSKPGNMTKGTDLVTLDGISAPWLEGLSRSLQIEEYSPKPSRRVFIPKPNGKFRPLGVSSPRDKIVQQAMRIVLEAVLDPRFLDTSHGFRPRKGCHTALRQIREWKGVSWFIEGDIKGFFDNIDHHILAKLLEKHFNEPRLIHLYWKFVGAGYVDWEKDRKSIIYSDTGVPQGGIISPLLSNLILHELDIFVESLVKKYEKQSAGQKPYLKSTEYHKFTMRINRLKKKIATLDKRSDSYRLAKVSYLKNIKHRRLLRSLVLNPSFTKLRYVRYADDWIIGVWGNKKLCSNLKELIQKKLESLKLELSLEKTLITNARTGRAKFLGTFIKKLASNKGSLPLLKSPQGDRRRSPTGNIWMSAPILDIVKKLASKEFLIINGSRWTPKTIGKFTLLPVRDIILRYQSILNGLLNYYSFADNKRRFNKIFWILKESLRKTISRKLRLNQLEFSKSYGKKNITINIGKTSKGIDKVISFSTPDLTRNPMRFLGIAKFRDPFDVVDHQIYTVKILDNPCANCNSTDQVEMHHVRSIKTINVKLTPFDKMMAKINRKQVPLCRKCHLEVHQGKYHGKSLRYMKLYKSPKG